MPAAQSTPLQGRRVLVVEDEMFVAMEAETYLQRQGCTIVGPVPDAERALALIETEALDACLLDLNLDGAASTPVAEALAAREVPFVIVSGYSPAASDAPILRDAPRLGKPITEHALVTALAQALA